MGLADRDYMQHEYARGEDGKLHLRRVGDGTFVTGQAPPGPPPSAFADLLVIKPPRRAGVSVWTVVQWILIAAVLLILAIKYAVR